LDPEERSWSLLKLAEASGVLIELADVGSLPEEYAGQARSLGTTWLGSASYSLPLLDP